MDAYAVKLVDSNDIADYVSNYGFGIISVALDSWKTTIHSLLPIEMLSDIFIVYFVLVCFIAPLLVGYWQDRKAARKVLSLLQKENENCKNQAEKMATDYRSVIDNYVQTHK